MINSVSLFSLLFQNRHENQSPSLPYPIPGSQKCRATQGVMRGAKWLPQYGAWLDVGGGRFSRWFVPTIIVLHCGWSGRLIRHGTCYSSDCFCRGYIIIYIRHSLAALRRAAWLRGRASDSRLREPGFESCAAVLKPWASCFTLHCSSSLSGIDEYLYIDSGQWWIWVPAAFAH